jgi:hypothetical protein
MMIIWIALAVLVILAICVLAFVTMKSRKRGLSASSVSRVQAIIQHADASAEPALKVLEYDKALDQLMYELGFRGSTGEKLMKAGPRFANKEALWRGHKLRNTVAHEHGANINMNEVNAFRSAVVQALGAVS